jgi:uncharacterized membrane protein HdeD (DUF308 family)
MFKSLSTSMIVRGVLAIAVGIIALAWPQVTVLALVILFAVYAFMAAGLQAARAFSSRTAGPVIGHLLLGLVDLAAGVIALAWPGPTALVLVLIVGVWAIVAGLVEIAAAFGHGEPAGTRALFILGGLIILIAFPLAIRESNSTARGILSDKASLAAQVVEPRTGDRAAAARSVAGNGLASWNVSEPSSSPRWRPTRRGER